MASRSFEIYQEYFCEDSRQTFADWKENYSPRLTIYLINCTSNTDFTPFADKSLRPANHLNLLPNYLNCTTIVPVLTARHLIARHEMNFLC
ncbi:MAG: hypothetical protein IPL67_06120 [Ignavibacteria bacterium]|nr:hypothetical protein [Ignavibacteria bacterium]